MSGFYSKMLVNTKVFGKAGIVSLLSDFAYTIKTDGERGRSEEFDKLLEEFSDEVGCRGDFLSAIRFGAGLNILLHDEKYLPIKIKLHRYLARQIQSLGADDDGNIMNEYYIPDDGSENTSDEDDSIALGNIEPEKVVEFVDSADDKIVNRANALIRNAGAMGDTITEDFAKRVYVGSNPAPLKAHYLQSAFELLNGCFNEGTPVCLFDDYPSTFPNAYVVTDAKANPEKYIVVELLFTY